MFMMEANNLELHAVCGFAQTVVENELDLIRFQLVRLFDLRGSSIDRELF